MSSPESLLADLARRKIPMPRWRAPDDFDRHHRTPKALMYPELLSTLDDGAMISVMHGMLRAAIRRAARSKSAAHVNTKRDCAREGIRAQALRARQTVSRRKRG